MIIQIEGMLLDDQPKTGNCPVGQCYSFTFSSSEEAAYWLHPVSVSSGWSWWRMDMIINLTSRLAPLSLTHSLESIANQGVLGRTLTSFHITMMLVTDSLSYFF